MGPHKTYCYFILYVSGVLIAHNRTQINGLSTLWALTKHIVFILLYVSGMLINHNAQRFLHFTVGASSGIDE